MPRERLDYGRRHGQHGDLWLPDAPPPPASGWPVVVLLHGGFWKALYTKSLMTPLAADVIDRGWAAWNLEYRRVGSVPRGGWPETFEDVGAGIDHLVTAARSFPLDLGRVVAVGHSAGGHLALWAAGRRRLPVGAPGVATDLPVTVIAAVGLAPVADLVEADRMGLGGGAVAKLIGGPPERHPNRYAAADPALLLPLGVPQVLVHGDADGAVPLALSRHYVERARAAGDDATLVELAGVNHMELIDPASAAWSVTLTHLHRLLT